MNEVKIVMFGDYGIGKSACSIRFYRDFFVVEYDTTIQDNFTKQIEINGESYIINILDTAGAEDISPYLPFYAEGGGGFIIGYSITSRCSFDNVSVFYNVIKKVKGDDYPAIIIIGNKCDLTFERQVSYEEGQELAELLNCGFYETSAKEKINIDEVFQEIAVRANTYQRTVIEK